MITFFRQWMTFKGKNLHQYDTHNQDALVTHDDERIFWSFVFQLLLLNIVGLMSNDDVSDLVG